MSFIVEGISHCMVNNSLTPMMPKAGLEVYVVVKVLSNYIFSMSTNSSTCPKLADTTNGSLLVAVQDLVLEASDTMILVM